MVRATTLIALTVLIVPYDNIADERDNNDDKNDEKNNEWKNYDDEHEHGDADEDVSDSGGVNVVMTMSVSATN